MSDNLRDMNVIVTGGAGNLGQAVVAACAARGARVTVLDARIDATPEGAVDARQLDLLDAAAVEATVGDLGPIDALVNAVGGFAMGTPVHETPAGTWEQMLDLNVRTVINAVQAVVPKMQRQGHGRIVNVGAAAAHSGLPQLGAYIASKSTVMRLTESMSEELKGQGINVNAVLPSVIDTAPNRAAMPDADPAEWVSPGDLAAVICFLCSDAARAVHGALIPVRGLS